MRYTQYAHALTTKKFGDPNLLPQTIIRFDDGRDVDAGWIDFTKQEQEQMFGKLQQQQHA